MKADFETNSSEAGSSVPPDSRAAERLADSRRKEAARKARLDADPEFAAHRAAQKAAAQRSRDARKKAERAAAVPLTGNHVEVSDDQPDDDTAARPEIAPVAALDADQAAKERAEVAETQATASAAWARHLAAQKASQDQAVAGLADPGGIAPPNGHDAAQAAAFAEVSPIVDDAESPEGADAEAAVLRDALRGVGFDAPDAAGLTGGLEIVWTEDSYLGAIAEALPTRLPDLVAVLMDMGGPKSRKEASDVIAGCKAVWKVEKGRARAAQAAEAKASSAAGKGAKGPVAVRDKHFLDLSDAERADELARAEAGAARLLGCADLLAEVEAAIRAQGAAGDVSAAVLAWLVFASRVLATPTSLAIRGSSSGGKSFLATKAINMHPANAVRQMTGGSPKSLIYERERFENTVIYLMEATLLQSADPADPYSYMLRTLQSEGRLIYETVEKVEGDRLETVRKEREGPVGLVLTTTGTLHNENENRLLSVYVKDDPDQTRASVDATSTADDRTPPDLSEWHDLGRWSEFQNKRVVVSDWALAAGRLLRSFAQTRIRRDWGQALSLVRAHALLRQNHRTVDAKGRVVATLEDYGAVRALVESTIAEANGVAITPRVRQVFEVIKAGAEVALATQTAALAQNAPGAASLDPAPSLTGQTVNLTLREIGDRIGASKDAAARAVHDAVAAEVIERIRMSTDSERSPGRYRLRLDNLDADAGLLPPVAEIEAKMLFGHTNRTP